MLGVFLDGGPEGVVGRDNVLVHDGVFAERWDLVVTLLPVGASRQLQFQAFGHHGELPRPYHGAVIGVGGPVGRVDGVGPVGGVGDEQADGSHQPGWEGPADVVGGLVDEGGELMVVCGVEEEQAEAVVGVHYFDSALVVVPFQA